MALPSSSFHPPSRAGFIAGRSLTQALIAFSMLLVIFIPLLGGAPIFSWRTLIAIIVMVLALINVKGSSLMHLAAVRLGFAMRKATGGTHWTVSPWAVDRVVGVIDVPGPTGERLMTFDMVDTRYRGACFLWDKANGEATAVLRMGSAPWLFQPDSVKTARADGWSRALKEIGDMDDVKRVVTQARCLPHLNPRSGGTGNAFADRDLREVETGRMRVSLGHDMILTVTLDLSGGVTAAQASERLGKRVGQITELLRSTGADLSDAMWLNAPRIRGEIKCLFDPDALSECPGGELPDEVPLSTNWDEYPDYCHVDRMFQKTMWVDRWPAEIQQAGWLNDLLSNGVHSLVFTQVWEPTPVGRAEHRLNNRQMEIDRRMGINRYLQRPTSERDIAEKRDIILRKRELAQGYGDVDFTGYVTVTAPTRDALDASRTYVDGFFRSHSAHLDMLRMQQWAGLLTAMPLGQAGR